MEVAVDDFVVVSPHSGIAAKHIYDATNPDAATGIAKEVSI